MSEEEEHIVQNELLHLFLKMDETSVISSKKMLVLEKMKKSSELATADFTLIADCADTEKRILANIDSSIHKVKQLQQLSIKQNTTRSSNHPIAQWMYTLEALQKEVRNLSDVLESQKKAAQNNDKSMVLLSHSKENDSLSQSNEHLREGKKVLEKITKRYLKQPFILNSQDSVQKNIIHYLYGVSLANSIFRKIS